MRVMVALEDRFFRTRNGNVYSNTVSDYAFWCRYLQVFDEVVVFARVCEVPQEELDKPQASGPNVYFMALAYYVGPWQYLKQHRKLNALAKKAITKADAFILRIPGRISTLLWYQLMKKKMPYGVEVIGSSLDSAKTSGANILLEALLKQIGPKNQREQCQYAAAAAYVTENYLQRFFSPGGWSTHYSSVDLPNVAIVTEAGLEEKIASLKEAAAGRKPIRICHVGTMAARYKAQDVLIEAVALCRMERLNLQLTLLGDGKYRQHFTQKAKVLGISKSAKFLGNLPSGESVRQQLDAADIFVLPSLTEGLPKVLIEAMARGLPCIASNVGGIPELLDAEDLVQPGDTEGLAGKIQSVLKNPKRLEKMARRNLQTAQEYRPEELNRRRVEFYKKVADVTKAWHAKENKHKS